MNRAPFKKKMALTQIKTHVIVQQAGELNTPITVATNVNVTLIGEGDARVTIDTNLLQKYSIAIANAYLTSGLNVRYDQSKVNKLILKNVTDDGQIKIGQFCSGTSCPDIELLDCKLSDYVGHRFSLHRLRIVTCEMTITNALNSVNILMFANPRLLALNLEENVTVWNGVSSLPWFERLTTEVLVVETPIRQQFQMYALFNAALQSHNLKEIRLPKEGMQLSSTVDAFLKINRDEKGVAEHYAKLEVEHMAKTLKWSVDTNSLLFSIHSDYAIAAKTFVVSQLGGSLIYNPAIFENEIARQIPFGNAPNVEYVKGISGFIATHNLMAIYRDHLSTYSPVKAAKPGMLLF